MREQWIKASWVLSVAVAFVLGPMSMRTSAVTILKLGMSMGSTDTCASHALKLSELVKAKTGGSVVIEVYPGSQLGTDQQMLQGVRLGSLDMGSGGIPWHTSFAPGIGILNLPYLFKDYDHVYRVLDGEIGQELAKKFLEPHGLKILGFGELGFRCLSNSKKEVTKPEDMRGLKIRLTGDPYHMAAFKIWGAFPIPMSASELYMALKTGTVDGQENSITTTYGLKVYEVQKYFSLTRHAYTAFAIEMNPKKYESLSPSEQNALLEGVKEANLYHRNLNRQVEITELKEMRENGLIITENPERDAFAQMIKSVHEDYAKTFGSEYIERINKMR